MSCFTYISTSYFNVRQKTQPKLGSSQYSNAGMVLDDELGKKEFAAVTSHRIDPHSMPVHRRSRAASYTPALDVTKVIISFDYETTLLP
jgi:hypothetical protein